MRQEQVELVEPTAALQAEFRAMADEYLALGDSRYDAPAANVPAYLTRLRKESRGEVLAAGRVPATTYWLVRDATSLLGSSTFRHEVNEALLHEGGHIGYNIRPSERLKGYGTLILRLMLHKARECGLTRVLVTCDTDNVASGKIIRKNGGVPESEVTSHHSGKAVSRYWIDLTALGPQSDTTT